MQTKIFEKIKKEAIESSEFYAKLIGIIEDENKITDLKPKKNMDLFIILSELGLLNENSNLDMIDEFHDYLFELGIECGIISGQKIIIDSILNEKIDIEEIMKINPEFIVNFNMKPTYIADMEEALKNG